MKGATSLLEAWTKCSRVARRDLFMCLFQNKLKVKP